MLHSNSFSSIFEKFKKNKVLFLFHAIVLVIVLINFPYGKYFIGWDALSPELNFNLNFNRGLHAGWQEEYGLGVMTGHGFAATLPHTIINYFLSLVLPTYAIRSVFTFLCFYLGGLGMFILVKNLIQEMYAKSRVPEIVVLASALAYLLSFGTIQIFAVQLEPFIVQFAVYPWILLLLTYLLISPTRKIYLLFILCSFIASIQGFIPSLFVVYISAVCLFLLGYVLFYPEKITVKLVRVLVILFLFFITNTYWLLQIFYYSISASSRYLESYNNLLSTSEFIEKSIKYGNLNDLILQNGLYLDNVNGNGSIFQKWINYRSFFLIPIIGYILFVISLFGIVELIKKKTWIGWGILFMFIALFTFMAIDIYPFKFVSGLLYFYSDFFRQAFRITFTKFGISYIFALSLLLPFGLRFLGNKISRFKQSTVVVIIIALIMIYALPIFKGEMLYKKLEVTIPDTYYQLQNYFSDQAYGRIALIPQDCTEGWYSYDWGYFGSGFLQYGIEQPIMMRTYDVWSNYNENYQWELSQAIREKDYDRVSNIFNKYAIRWILYDQNITHCRDQKSILQYDELIDYFDSNKVQYKKVKTFTDKNIKSVQLYEIVNNKLSTPVSLIQNPLTVGPKYSFTDIDSAFDSYRNYIVDDTDLDIYYPFRDLFSKRTPEENTFSIEETENEIIIRTNIQSDVTGKVVLPDYLSYEDIVPISLSVEEENSDSKQINITYYYPSIYIDGNQVVNGVFSENIYVGQIPENFSLLNNGKIVDQDDNNGNYQGVFSKNIDNTITILTAEGEVFMKYTKKLESSESSSYILPKAKKQLSSTIEIRMHKYNDPNGVYNFTSAQNISSYNPISCAQTPRNTPNYYEKSLLGKSQFIRMENSMSSQCLTIQQNNMSTSYSYLLAVQHQYNSGSPLRFYVTNEKGVRYIDVLLPKHSESSTDYLLIPATFPGSLGYSFTIQNSSLLNQITSNDFISLSAQVMPFHYLKNIIIQSEKYDDLYNKNVSSLSYQDTIHHNSSSYSTSIIPKDNSVLILSQSFDPGWHAYQLPNYELRITNYVANLFPFLFGEELTDHVLVNNWANGWILPKPTTYNPQPTTIKIVYLPQYLQYVGFVMFILGLISIVPWGTMNIRKHGNKL